MSRSPEMITADAIDEFWKVVAQKRLVPNINGLKAVREFERMALDAAATNMALFIMLRVSRLAVEAEEAQ